MRNCSTAVRLILFTVSLSPVIVGCSGNSTRPEEINANKGIGGNIEVGRTDSKGLKSGRTVKGADRNAFEVKQAAQIEKAKAKAKAEQGKWDAFLKHERLARELASQKKWPEAIKHQREAVKLQPKDRRVRYELAILFLQAKKLDEAKTELQKLTGQNDQFGNNAKKLLKHLAAESGRSKMPTRR